jgi:hypothetical protein
MLYFLMLITTVVLWRALKINLIIAASVSVVFWGIVGPIISYHMKRKKGGRHE